MGIQISWFAGLDGFPPVQMPIGTTSRRVSAHLVRLPASRRVHVVLCPVSVDVAIPGVLVSSKLTAAASGRAARFAR